MSLGHWVLLTFAFLVFWLGWSIIFSARIGFYYFSTSAKAQGIFYNPDGTFDHKVLVVSIFGKSFDWKLSHPNPRKVRFKVRPQGFAKSYEMEWDREDLIERHSRDGDKMFIEFGIKNRDYKSYVEKKMLMDIRNHLSAELDIVKNRYNELKTRFDQKVIEYAEKAHEFTPKFYKPPKGSQSAQG